MAMTDAPVDPTRLARAVHLECEQLEDGRWRIWGGAATHIVGPGESCDCTDFALHGSLCKHVARVQLAALSPAVLAALRAVVQRPKRVRGARH